MKYQDLNTKQSEELNDFPMFFAFSMEQFERGLKDNGWKKDDIFAIPGGGWMLKTSKADFIAMFKRHESELAEAFKDDAFLKEAIRYELGNHEYGYTGDPTDTLDALDLKLDDERTARIFREAREQYFEENKDNF